MLSFNYHTRQKQSWSMQMMYIIMYIIYVYMKKILKNNLREQTKCLKYFHLILFKLTTTFVTKKQSCLLLTSVYDHPGE